jgi:hypothetical protein
LYTIRRKDIGFLQFSWCEESVGGESNLGKEMRWLAAASQQGKLKSGQVAPDFAGFLGLVLTGFFAGAGLMESGRPVPTGVTDGSGPGPKWTRHPGLS